MLDLVLLLRVDHHLFGQVLLDHALLLVHRVDPILQGLLVLLALCKLNFNVPQGLLKFLNLSQRDSKLLHSLSSSHRLSRLNLVHSWWELGSGLSNLVRQWVTTYSVYRVFSGHLNSNL